VSGVIVGRALYDGRIDLAEAIRALGEPRLMDATGMAADLA
jgi:phosphoribosylformimino-5-aminoimidazole carboxamide ribotide isomerase